MGGVDLSGYTSVSNGLASHWYAYERGDSVYDGRSITWIGKIGLMYSSDYAYATEGGITTNRSACLEKELYHWNELSVSDCKNNNWLYTGYYQWALTPYSSNSSYALHVFNDGSVGNGCNVNNMHAIRPVLYLSSNVQITGGTGEKETPYAFSLIRGQF